ncbi:TniQ family protein [Nonomuraea sp. NPDC048916]|uniref:helix-turn-helix domain-containing protein n=1 Tax=Nonomuraea sp. NPDC048916 TaxID=3154232 RepID=UPI0033D6D093
MLPQDRAEKILTLGQAGWSVRAIADQLGHSPQTIRDYLNGRTTPGLRAPRPSLLTDPLADYCRQRLAEDPHLRPSTLFNEVTELGFQGSRATFYRELSRRLPSLSSHGPSRPQEDLPQDLPGMSHPSVHTHQHAPVLPRPVAPITGEALTSYLTRLAHANHLTLTEVLAVLPSWFSTKINNRDDRAQHHMLIPATAKALHALAHLATTTSASLARALPAFGAVDTHSPVRATTACHRCTARRGVHQPVPVHLPAHQKICTRHGIWLSDADQPHLDLAACPEIITAQRRANRLLRHCTPQQLMSAHLVVAKMIPPWPSSPAGVPFHWRHRLLILQTANHRLGIATDHDAYIDAAKYPDAIALAATMLTPSHPHGIEQDSLAKPSRSPRQRQL